MILADVDGTIFDGVDFYVMAPHGAPGHVLLGEHEVELPVWKQGRQHNGGMKTGMVHDERHLEAGERHGVTVRRLCLLAPVRGGIRLPLNWLGRASGLRIFLLGEESGKRKCSFNDEMKR